MTDFTSRELAIIAAALDYMAAESTLEERRPVLAHTRRSDVSSAPLRKLANRARSLATPVDPITSSPRVRAALAAVKCACPDDCNCRKPWRTNYCGCSLHEDRAV